MSSPEDKRFYRLKKAADRLFRIARGIDSRMNDILRMNISVVSLENKTDKDSVKLREKLTDRVRENTEQVQALDVERRDILGLADTYGVRFNLSAAGVSWS